MNKFKIPIVIGLALLALTSVAALAAQEQKPRFEETLVVTATPRAGSSSEYFLTFSGPVSVPGMSLPGGTYLFKFPSENVKAIQILKADRSDVYVTFHTMPVEDIKRGLTTEGQELTWIERPAGQAPAIKNLVPSGSVDRLRVHLSEGLTGGVPAAAAAFRRRCLSTASRHRAHA